MTTIDDHVRPRTFRFASLHPLLALLSERLEARRNRTQARRVIKVLAALDDRILADVGVTRRELHLAERRAGAVGRRREARHI